MSVVVRPETEHDHLAASQVIQRAFMRHALGNRCEHLIVDALRTAGALSLGVVAHDGEQLVGHLTFSPITISDGSMSWYALGPVAVSPEFQGRGIASSLIEYGLAQLRQCGAAGCVVFGSPDCYRRFGFSALPSLELEDVPKGYFLALAFTESTASGVVTYHEAFLMDA